MSDSLNDSRTKQDCRLPNQYCSHAKALMREFCMIQVCYPTIRGCQTLLVLSDFFKGCEKHYAYSLQSCPTGFASIRVLSLIIPKFYGHVRREKIPNLSPVWLA